MSTLKQLKDRAQATRQHFEAAVSKLYRGDGEPIYAEAEMHERLRELRSERNRQLDAIEATVEEKRQEASEGLQALEDGSPVAWLSEGELEHAASRQALIAADVASLDNDGLRRRLLGVIHGGKRGSQLGYYLAARARVRSGDLDTAKLLEDLRESAIPDTHRQKVREARASLEEAGEIKGMVYLARREQTSAYSPNYAVSGR